MAAQPQRTLADRWYFGVLPQLWERAVDVLQSRLANLERVLGVLHRAVEHPAPTLDASTVAATGSVTVSATTDAALTGASFTFTPPVDMNLLVSASYDAECSLFGAVTHNFIGSLYLNGVALTGLAICSPAALGHRQMPSQTWNVPLAAGTEYTLALYGRTSNVATQFLVRLTHTRFSVARFPNLFKT